MVTERVALDAMGGDGAPQVTVAGALKAVAEHDVDVVLVGQSEPLRQLLQQAGAPDRLEVVEAAQTVTMDEDPMAALRSKPDASVRVACRLVAEGEAAAVVSAGSTGATLAAALLTLGRSPGVRRPTVAAVLPLAGGGRVVLADAGGSMDVHADVFPGYAAMGLAYAEVLGTDHPTVGLLNVGAERGKGNGLAKDAYAALSGLPSFAGNVEPGAVLAGKADVVVTDGFTGNVFLKTVEAALGPGAGEGDAAAMLLGVKGEVLVAHGAASADDVAQALGRAEQVARAGLAARISRRLTAEDAT